MQDMIVTFYLRQRDPVCHFPAIAYIQDGAYDAWQNHTLRFRSRMVPALLCAQLKQSLSKIGNIFILVHFSRIVRVTLVEGNDGHACARAVYSVVPEIDRLICAWEV